MMDLFLVFLFTFTAMSNYYGLAATAGAYTASLNMDIGISGIL